MTQGTSYLLLAATTSFGLPMMECVITGQRNIQSRFGYPGDLIGKIEGTILDYNEDFGCLKPVRMVFKKDKERERAAEIIKDDAKRLTTVFIRLSHATKPKALANKHLDIRSNHIIAILAMRGDLNKSLISKIMQQTIVKEESDMGAAEQDMHSRGPMTRKDQEKNFFSQLNVPNPYSLVGK